MREFFENFFADESGAVTVDWVVLAATVVGLSLAVMAAVSEGAAKQSGDLRDTLTVQLISTTF